MLQLFKSYFLIEISEVSDLRSIVSVSAVMILCFLFCEMSDAQEENFQATITVVGQDGKPVVGATAATAWNFTGKKWYPAKFPHFSANSDQTGVVKLDLGPWRDRWPVIVYDKDRKNGALVVVLKKQQDHAYTARLEPLVSVQSKVGDGESGKPIGSFLFNLRLKGGDQNHLVAYSAAPTPGGFEVLLPKGEYELRMGGGDRVRLRMMPLNITSSKPVLKLKDFSLSKTPLTKLKGKPVPRLSLVPEGLGKTLQVSDYMGKWVLLYFWGHG